MVEGSGLVEVGEGEMIGYWEVGRRGLVEGRGLVVGR